MGWIVGFFDISIDRANQFYSWGWRASVIGAVITMCGVALLWFGTRVRDRDFDANIAELHGKASASEERSKALDVKAAELTLETEKLRRENLEIGIAAAPRMILITNPVREALGKFSGMKVFVSAVPDFEPQRFARQLAGVLLASGWIVEGRPLDPNSFMDGVGIEYEAGLLKDKESDPDRTIIVDFHANQRQEDAAKALANVLKDVKIASQFWQIPMGRSEQRRPGVPSDALSIKIGMKPTDFFLERQYPQIKEIRDGIEKTMEDAKQRAQERTTSQLPAAEK